MSITSKSSRVQHGKRPGVNFDAIRWVHSCRGLTASEWRLLSILAAHYNSEKGYCWPSQQTLAEACETTRPFVSRTLTTLAQKGFISYERGGRVNGTLTENRYFLNFETTNARYPGDTPPCIPQIPGEENVFLPGTPPSDHVSARYPNKLGIDEDHISGPGPGPAEASIRGETNPDQKVGTGYQVDHVPPAILADDKYRCPDCGATTVIEHIRGTNYIRCHGREKHSSPYAPYAAWLKSRQVRESAPTYVA